MAKRKVPTAAEVRGYITDCDAYIKDCIDNNKTCIITGPSFPGESIWKAKATLPLLEAAEEVGTSTEEIWELCKKLASTTHAPVTKKEYERMIPFAEKPNTVNAVLKFLETYIPPFEEKYYALSFDIPAYYYCLALISFSDYRHEDCEKQLWTNVHCHIEKDEDKGIVLLRNMKVLEKERPFLTPMKIMLENAQNGLDSQ